MMQILDGKVRGNLSLYLKENTEKGCNLYISSPFFTGCLIIEQPIKDIIKNNKIKINILFCILFCLGGYSHHWLRFK